MNGINKTTSNGHSTANGKSARDDPLDHDFHSGWGSTYTYHGVSRSQRSRDLWYQYASDPSKIEQQYHSLLHEYTERFHDFFRGYWPMSLHAHVSDVMVPSKFGSLILQAASNGPPVMENPALSPLLTDQPEPEKIKEYVRGLLGWTEEHVFSPRFAMVEGIYGSSFGPLAHASKEWEVQIHGSGLSPVVIPRHGVKSEEELLERLTHAKQEGCIAVVVDMMSTTDGTTLCPTYFRQLRSCCGKVGLFLIVDEALTAVRCGAPFACQRKEYAEGADAPDMVVFGKGIGVSGISVNFDGPTMKRLAYKKREDMLHSIRLWRALISRPMPIPVMITALGILDVAEAEDWPGRSVLIGEAVRSVIRRHVGTQCRDREFVRGLGAIIVVDREISMQFRVMTAIRRRSRWVRWLPKLDGAAIDPEAIEKRVVGAESKKYRQALAREAEEQGTAPLWCLVCGIDAAAEDWCRTCFLSYCGTKDCETVFKQHKCVG